MPKRKFVDISLAQEPYESTKSVYHQIFDLLDTAIGSEVQPFEKIVKSVARALELSENSTRMLLLEMEQHGYVIIT